MGEHVACNGEKRNAYEMPMMKRDHLGNQCIDRRIVLKLILKEEGIH
jgi:hypothetical protein